MMAFSVAVTEASSRKMSAPTSLLACSVISPSISTRAPSSFRARKCVSRRRRPITSPPGGGRVTLPQRASRGPANRMEARTWRASSAGTAHGAGLPDCRRQAWSPTFSAREPSCRRMSIITCTSSISGMLRRTTGSSVSRVAARQGSAAFLLPLGRRRPCSGWPPSIRYLNIRSLEL